MMGHALPKKAEALQNLIAAEIAANPFEFEGFQWCAMPQPVMAMNLGFSVRTLRDIISQPPFVRDYTEVEGKKAILLRVGEPGPKTPRHVANIMANIMRRRFARDITRDEYGCLIGLAETWPPGYQVEIFKLVISKEGWPAFMAAVQTRIALMVATTGEGKHGKFPRPTPSVIRRFHDVALEFYTMEQQIKHSGTDNSKPWVPPWEPKPKPKSGTKLKLTLKKPKP